MQLSYKSTDLFSLFDKLYWCFSLNPPN